MRHYLLLVTAFIALAASSGCKSDCGIVCEKRQECLVDDLDVGECVDDCQDASDDDNDHAEQAAECAECLDPRSCSETFNSCIDDCFTVSGWN